MHEAQPVIIAGSGPAGSALALYLAQRNIPVLVLEKEPSLPIDLRASTFHPPSLEMLNQLGVAAPMIARGLVVDRYQYRDRRTGDVAGFDMSLIADETLLPFRLQLEQYEMTLLVNRMLADYHCAEVRFGHQVLGFTYDEKFLVASTDFPFEEAFDQLAWVNYVADPEEWCVILRTDKLWRVLWPTDPAIEDEQHFLRDHYLQGRLHHLHDISGDYNIGHRTLYHVHQRVAETYYRGRVALVGDACHINNPLGGMGMNGGLHDALSRFAFPGHCFYSPALSGYAGR